MRYFDFFWNFGEAVLVFEEKGNRFSKKRVVVFIIDSSDDWVLSRNTVYYNEVVTSN